MEYVLTFTCPDRAGLVYMVTSWLFERGCNILDSDQYGDPHSGLFFMRVHFSGEVPVEVPSLALCWIVALVKACTCPDKVRQFSITSLTSDSGNGSAMTM